MVTCCDNYGNILITEAEVTLVTEGTVQAMYGDSRRIINRQIKNNSKKWLFKGCKEKFAERK
jgi:hypothetical protein